MYLRDGRRRLCARVDDQILDLADAALSQGWDDSDLMEEDSLDALMAAGSSVWRDVHREVGAAAVSGDYLVPLSQVELVLPFTVADYVDFYASEHHAMNLGQILRPGQEPLQPNWRHQPVGYHGRAGTVVVSGTPVRRPSAHVRDGESVAVRASERLDVEAEVGFVVGRASERGRPVPIEEFADHVFGVVLLNDWSARDIQAWETVPLGPFLGKSFQTSISPWVTPIDAFAAARVPSGSAGSELSSYLVEPEPWGLDIAMELLVNGNVVSRPPYRLMHWSPAQMMAHLTINGASLRTGDLFASGTVSGPTDHEVGSLIEAWGNERFLAAGDEVMISATAPAVGGGRLDLGVVCGRVLD